MNHTTEQPPDLEPEKWPRLGALAAVPGRDGAWSIWSRGCLPPPPQRQKWGRQTPTEGWWLVPVDATEAERAAQAVLLRETEFGPYVPDETGVLW